MIACRFSVTTPPLVDASEPPPLMILKSVVWAARLAWRQSACTCDEARTPRGDTAGELLQAGGDRPGQRLELGRQRVLELRLGNA